MRDHYSKPYVGRVSPAKTAHPGYFWKGNQLSKPENLSAEANQKRFKALCKTWKLQLERAARGEKKAKGMSRAESKFRSPRIRLRVTVARESRDIQDMARTMATAAMERAMDIIADPNSQDSAALSAAELILNRAYGKPNQTNTNLNADLNGKSTEVGSAELDKRITDTLKRVDAIAGRAEQAAKSKKRPADLRKLDRDPNGPDERIH
jgi:hypothetical protein